MKVLLLIYLFLDHLFSLDISSRAVIDDLAAPPPLRALHPPIPPALEPPPLSSPSICGIPGFPFVLLIYPESGGAGSAAPLAPARRAGTKPGLLPEKWDESKSPQKGNCQGNPQPPWCLTFICCLFFLFFLYTPNGVYPRCPPRGW